jgi:hypothetical protein
MTETSKGRETRLREASATEAVDCDWAASIASNPLLAAGQDSLERLCEANRELLGFWRSRIECFGDASQRIPACRSLEEMQQIQGHYLQDMLRAYAGMWSRLPTLLFMRPTAGETPSAAEGSPRVA